MQEIWKDVKDYEGIYQVSNLGNVKSLPKEWFTGKGAKMKHNGKLLKPMINTFGYLHVSLYKDLKQKTFTIHKLVLTVFTEYKPNGRKIVIDHINNIKTDNRLDNLQAITQRLNASKDKKNKTSKYTGVSWSKYKNKWVANISINEKYKNLGCFKTEEEAHLVYQKKLKEIEL